MFVQYKLNTAVEHMLIGSAHSVVSAGRQTAVSCSYRQRTRKGVEKREKYKVQRLYYPADNSDCGSRLSGSLLYHRDV